MTKPRTIYCMAAVCALCVGFLQGAAYALSESTAEEGSNAQAVHDPCGPNETGQGVTVGIMGNLNVYLDHEAFDGVDISNYDATGSGTYPHWHDTFIAGIIVSQGSTAHPAYADDIGVAPSVSVRSMRVSTTESSIEEGLRELIKTHACRVIVNGYHDPSAIPDGESFITLMYDYYAYAENVVLALPAGKEDTDYPGLTTVSVPGDAYNGITTSGLILSDPADEYVYRRVGTESLPGPTTDGRRKPDIAAPSDSQDVPKDTGRTVWANTRTYGGSVGATSYSGPHTAGVAALLLGFADSSGEVSDNRHEVIKAVIVNSAFPNIDDRLGNPTNPIDPNNTWHVDRGYGRIDALRAYETLAAGSISKDTVVTSGKGWAYDSVDADSEHTYIVNAPKNSRLRITLTWDRKIVWQNRPPMDRIDNGELTADTVNLDLQLYEPNEPGNAIFGGLDTNDNLEKCDLLLAASGNYVLKVVSRPANTFTTNYALAFELVAPIPGDFDLNYIVNYDDLAVLMQQWLGPEPDPRADLWPDGKVDLLDVAVFGQNWLKMNQSYYQQD